MKNKGRRIAIMTGFVAFVLFAFAVYLGWPHLRSWYRFWQLFEPLGRNAQGFDEYRHRQTGIVMVSLPGGKFWMGAQKTDPKGKNYYPQAEDNEGPVHEVTLSPFLIGKYEVTQGQWKAVMGSNPSKFIGDDERPVELISWNDIQGFNAKTGLRLPTEAEWEYACRGGSKKLIAGTGNLDEISWYRENSGGTLHRVGMKAANGFGLHDMYGNVWEWCEDVYDEGFYGKPEASGPDPVAKSGSRYRVFRGGSWWIGIAWYCRSSSFRNYEDPLIRWNDPSIRIDFVGCRPVWRGP